MRTISFQKNVSYVDRSLFSSCGSRQERRLHGTRGLMKERELFLTALQGLHEGSL